MASLSSMKTVRTVEVRYESTGADKVRSDADKVTDAQDRMAQSAQRAATVTEQASKRQLSAAAAYDKVRASVDAGFKAQQQFEKTSRTVDRAFNQGIIDQQERERTLEQARSRFTPQGNDNEPGRKGLSTYDKQFIKYQGFDVASSLGSGAGLGTVAFQQGPQVLQQLADREGGLKQGLKELGSSALGLVTPMTVAGTAVVGLGAAFALAASQAARDQDILQKATQGIGAGTGATVSQLDALAKSNAEAGKVSTSTSREIVASYASLGSLSIPIISDLTRVTAEYARQTGQETVAATTELGRAFSDLSSGVDTIAGRMGALGDTTRQLITAQMEQGNQSGAQQTLADALKASIDANAQSTTGWASAWNTATAAANGYWEAAKRIAGIKLGVAPEGAGEAVARLQTLVDTTNKNRQLFGLEPLSPVNNENARQLEVAKVIADQERMIAEGKAAEQRAKLASEAAGNVTRSYDPNLARLGELRTQQGQLRDALADPLARGRLSDLDATDSAYRAATRAIESMTDAQGNLISKQDLARRGDQLRLEALKATTAEEKASIAERQKAYDLIGKPLTNSEARDQVGAARTQAMASEAKSGGSAGKKGGGSDAADEYDRALKSTEDRIRRMDQEAQTMGMGAQAVARYRAETDLLTAAKRAERDITPELTAQIQDYANKAGEAAQRQEELREKMQDMDALRSGGRDVISGIGRDLSRGASQADILNNALGRLSDRLMDMATTSISDSLFGKRGGSDGGMLGGLLSSMLGGGGGGLSSLFGGGGPDLSVGSDSNWLFAGGGYTGPGARLQPAGIVHAGEYVFDQQSVARIGLGNLAAMHKGMAGYADGGFVPAPTGEGGEETGWGEVLAA